MIIKTPPRWWQNLKRFKRKEKTLKKQRQYLPYALFILLAVSLLVNLFAFNELKFLTELYQEELETPKAATLTTAERQLAEADEATLPYTVSADQLPLINLDIKFKHFKKIRKERQQALDRGILIAGEDSFVPAVLRYGEEHIKAKLRLKGDWLDHLRAETKWSFRVHTKKGAPFMGMRRFSLQSPKTRAYQKEPLFIELAREMGVIAPRYSFVRLFVNGEDWGVMALEEGFSSELLEYHQRKAAVIIRYDESDAWAAVEADNLTMAGNLLGDYQGATIDSFSSGKVSTDPVLNRYQRLAIGLLRGFSDRELSASQVFDVEQTAAYMALCHLFGNWHGLVWHNMRFYYNPISGRLEPIVFDVSQIDSESKFLKSKIVNQMLEDPELREAYQAAVAALGERLQSKELSERILALDKQWRAPLIEEFGEVPPLNVSQIFRNYNQMVAQTFPAPNTDIDKLVGAWVVGRDDGLLLEIRNLTPVPVTVTSLSLNGTALDTPERKTPFYLYPRSLYYPGKSEFFHLRVPADTPAERIVVEASLNDGKHVARHRASDYILPRQRGVLPQETAVNELLESNPFLQFDFSRNCLVPEAGEWRVTGALIPPSGVGLCIDGGTRLKFAREGFVLLRNAPLRIDGSEQQPVVLTADSELWGGVAVMDSPELSTLHFAQIENTRGVAREDWSLTGGATFYKSAVEIQNSVFRGHQGEDALNVVHAQLQMRNSLVEETLSDGLDGDFITGTVANVTFRNIGLAGGGDGLDVSGSTLAIEACTFTKISDKGISVGEASQVVATNCRAEECGVGAAAKDGSTLTLDNFSVKSGRLAGLMAYIKKSEYGPAKIEARVLTVDQQTPHRALAQKRSLIRIDGHKVATRKIDVERLYDTVMRPGVEKQ